VRRELSDNPTLAGQRFTGSVLLNFLKDVAERYVDDMAATPAVDDALSGPRPESDFRAIRQPPVVRGFARRGRRRCAFRVVRPESSTHAFNALPPMPFVMFAPAAGFRMRGVRAA
jgi:hypothetical protein